MDIQLSDQLEEVLPNQTTDLDNSPDGMASKIGTNFYYNPVIVRQLSLEKIQVQEALETFFRLLNIAVLNYSTQSAKLNICASLSANPTNV